MNEVSEHLANNVIPPVGTRQWVLTLPYTLRYRLAYDRELVGPVLDAYVKSIFSSLRRRANLVSFFGGTSHTRCAAFRFRQIQRKASTIPESNLEIRFFGLRHTAQKSLEPRRRWREGNPSDHIRVSRNVLERLIT
jgi:hypothetical protein